MTRSYPHSQGSPTQPPSPGPRREVAIVEDPGSPGGGYALIRIAGVTDPSGDASFWLRRVGYDRNNLGPHGWQSPECRLRPVEVQGGPDGVELLIGPEVVDVLEVGMPIELSIPAFGVRARLIWPDIPPSILADTGRGGRLGFAERRAVEPDAAPPPRRPAPPPPAEPDPDATLAGVTDPSWLSPSDPDATLASDRPPSPDPDYDQPAPDSPAYDAGAARADDRAWAEDQAWAEPQGAAGQYEPEERWEPRWDEPEAEPTLWESRPETQPETEDEEATRIQQRPPPLRAAGDRDRRRGAVETRHSASRGWLVAVLLLLILGGLGALYFLYKDELGLPWPSFGTAEAPPEPVPERPADPEPVLPPPQPPPLEPPPQEPPPQEPPPAPAMTPGPPPTPPPAPPTGPQPRPGQTSPADFARTLVQGGLSPERAFELAQFHLGQSPPDTELALLLLEQAADRSHGPALVAYGRMYDPVQFDRSRSPFSGPNPARAAELYRRAQQAGDPDAAPALAALRAWLERAAAGGDPEAQQILNEQF